LVASEIDEETAKNGFVLSLRSLPASVLTAILAGMASFARFCPSYSPSVDGHFGRVGFVRAASMGHTLSVLPAKSTKFAQLWLRSRHFWGS
jgi:hypothetical protein